MYTRTHICAHTHIHTPGAPVHGVRVQDDLELNIIEAKAEPASKIDQHFVERATQRGAADLAGLPPARKPSTISASLAAFNAYHLLFTLSVVVNLVMVGSFDEVHVGLFYGCSTRERLF